MVKILLLTKRNETTAIAQKLVKKYFKEVKILDADTIPSSERSNPNYVGDDEKFDYMISFLFYHRIPKDILEKADVRINFHPGSEKYGGFGYNFALYNEDKQYGVICHHMTENLDSGNIIEVRYFDIKEEDDVESLRDMSHIQLLNLFRDMLIKIRDGKALPRANVCWSGYYSRKDFLNLCEILPDVKSEEIRRRVRATYMPGAKDGPYILIDSLKFKFIEK